MSLDPLLLELQHKYAALNHARVDVLEAAAADPSPERMTAGAVAAHQLAGSLASIGLAEAGAAAQELNARFASGPPAAEEIAALAARIRRGLGAA